MSNAFLPETRERFLQAIARQVPADQIAEIHFFAPIKQGGIESGVAVVAAWPDALSSAELPVAPLADAPPSDPDDSRAAERPSGRAADSKPVIYTARYRLVLKGPDRGKWETSLTAEADAPLVSVDAVVRGVQRRSGDVEAATRMEGPEIRESLRGRV